MLSNRSVFDLVYFASRSFVADDLLLLEAMIPYSPVPIRGAKSIGALC